MQRTSISWAVMTWGVWSGCDKVSPGCLHCYAEKDANNPRYRNAFPNGFDLTLRPHRLKGPLRLKQPTRIFVNSTSDFFWENVADEMRDQVLDVIRTTPQHTYLVLTKRTKKMLEYVKTRKLPPNFWAGVSVENQKYTFRVDDLRRVDVPVRFISAEPLLGPLDLDLSGINQVIVGGESGPHLKDAKHADRGLVHRVNRKWQPRPDRIDWIRKIRDDCQRAGVCFFFKQWGGPKSDSCGHELDGREWQEIPPWRPTRIVHTIGYEGKELSSVVSALKAAHVEILVDVRRRAGNGRKPVFAKRHLSETLVSNGIEYRHLPDLGPSHELRKRERDGEIDRPGLLTAYRCELDGRMEHVDALLKLVQQHRCCLMCQEADSVICHRAVLAALLVECGTGRVQVSHL